MRGKQEKKGVLKQGTVRLNAENISRLVSTALITNIVTKCSLFVKNGLIRQKTVFLHFAVQGVDNDYLSISVATLLSLISFTISLIMLIK